MNTPEVYAALRERFAAPEWAIFFEVANGTGHHGRRYADAVAMVRAQFTEQSAEAVA